MFVNLYGAYFVNANVGWVVGDAGTISKNYGWWTNLDTYPRKDPLGKIVHAVDEQNAWVAGELGSIMVTTDGRKHMD